jgi:hypothetical protein
VCDVSEQTYISGDSGSATMSVAAGASEGPHRRHWRGRSGQLHGEFRGQRRLRSAAVCDVYKPNRDKTVSVAGQGKELPDYRRFSSGTTLTRFLSPRPTTGMRR